MPKQDIQNPVAKGLDSDAVQHLDSEIKNLKSLLKNLEDAKGKLDTNELAALAEVSTDLEYRAAMVDRLYKRKGFFYSMAVKVPLKILNVGSLRDSQQFMRDSIRGVTSPICVMCNSGILMHQKDQVPVNGQVLWFCSNDTACSFSVWAASSNKDVLMMDVRQKINKDISTVGQNRWTDLSEAEKENLIEGHLSKANMLKWVTLVLGGILIFDLVMQFWWAFIMMLPVMCLAAVLSVKWCYRAWQIKTGNIFLPESMFMNWLKTAKEYYSVDWVDQDESEKGEVND